MSSVTATPQNQRLRALPNDERSSLVVAAQDAARTYQRGAAAVVALQHATCTIARRDRIALVGRSGSGKSTLLHLLGGLDTPTSGMVSWPALGARTTLRPTKVAFVFQMPSLLPPLTVVENVELPLLLGNADAAAARAAALKVLARMDLLPLTDKLPEELSGGQAQRVAMARALAYQPKLILADEPTGQLDRSTAHHLFDVLLAALADTDTALVVATHDDAVAKRLDQVWHIHLGVLEGATR